MSTNEPIVAQWLNESMKASITAMPSEQSLFSLLKVKYNSDAYALFSQVRDKTGAQGSRTADAIAFGLWPSRGLEVEGFEMKVSRADWIKERDDPAKADVIYKYCDRWWLVVSEEKIVHPGELPSTWGMMVQRGDKLVIKTQAPKLEPVPLERGFIASLMRRVQDMSVPRSEVNAQIDQAYKQGMEMGTRSKDNDNGFARQEVDRLRNMIHKFQEASGVEIDRWNSGPLP